MRTLEEIKTAIELGLTEELEKLAIASQQKAIRFGLKEDDTRDWDGVVIFGSQKEGLSYFSYGENGTYTVSKSPMELIEVLSWVMTQLDKARKAGDPIEVVANGWVLEEFSTEELNEALLIVEEVEKIASTIL